MAAFISCILPIPRAVRTLSPLNPPPLVSERMGLGHSYSFDGHILWLPRLAPPPSDYDHSAELLQFIRPLPRQMLDIIRHARNYTSFIAASNIEMEDISPAAAAWCSRCGSTRRPSTIAVYMSINNPLRAAHTPHPMLVLVHLLTEAIKRLRTVEGRSATRNEPATLWVWHAQRGGRAASGSSTREARSGRRCRRRATWRSR